MAHNIHNGQALKGLIQIDLYTILFLFEECMVGDVNLFFDECQQDTAEIEIMIAGTN